MAYKDKEKAKEHNREWYRNHPEVVKQKNNEIGRKGGKYYQKTLERERKGLRRQRNIIRHKHSKRWRKYKGNWLTKTQIHHEWIEGTAGYKGVALVEANQHMHGCIDVIRILEGEITLFAEAEVMSKYGLLEQEQ